MLRFFAARMPEAVAAVVAASLLFVLPVNLRQLRFTITWEEAAKIDWGTIFLFGGGLSLGKMMFETGVAEALGRGVTGLMGQLAVDADGDGIAIGIVLSELTSNTSAANMVIPVVIAMAQAAGVDPVPPPRRLLRGQLRLYAARFRSAQRDRLRLRPGADHQDDPGRRVF